MAISFLRPDPSSASAVAAANFSVARRGYDQEEVRDFLRMVSAELSRLQERERFLERELQTVPRPEALDEQALTDALGAEAERILQAAKDAAAETGQRAQEEAEQILRSAFDEAARVREDELRRTREQGRDMVNEARAYREKVVADLARRRESAVEQLEALAQGRDRLVQSFERARLAAVDVLGDLDRGTSPATGNPGLPPSSPAAAPITSARPRRSVDELFATLRSGIQAPVAAPTAAAEQTPFQHRSDALASTIAAVARQLKRVLADEQNDLLSQLDGEHGTFSLDGLLGSERDQRDRYIQVVVPQLRAAATAGAESMMSGPGLVADMDDSVLAPAIDRVVEDHVVPLRDRLERGVTNADGDRVNLAAFVRGLYREWKHRLDELAAEWCLLAYGCGAFSVLPAGTEVEWVGDPDGSRCPDAANASAGGIAAGQCFPSGHQHPPTGGQCRCLLVPKHG